jgi:hypothetical protein
MISSSIAEICDLAPSGNSYQEKSNRRINFNSLNKSVISLSVMIGALGSPLGPIQKVI